VPRTQLMDVEVNPVALINDVDDAPLGQAKMWVDEPATDGMAPYKRLAAAVLAQLAPGQHPSSGRAPQRRVAGLGVALLPRGMCRMGARSQSRSRGPR
jgi:hypothetical protein